MPSSKIDLSPDIRAKVTPLIAAALADATDLMLQAKQAHWNVKGPAFIALHELFDKVSEEAEEYVDMLAERIVQFGGIAEGTLRVAAAKSRLREYPLTITSGSEHVAALSDALATFGKHVRRAIDESAGDAGTADLFTEISRGVDKLLWFVEAHAH